MSELWTVEKAAAYWQVSPGRARAILADRGIRRVSGYPSDEILAVTLRQGARNDLADANPGRPDGLHEDQEPAWQAAAARDRQAVVSHDSDHA